RRRGARLDREAGRLSRLPGRLRSAPAPRRRLSRAVSASTASALRRASLVLLLSALIWGAMIPVLGHLAQHYDKWLLAWLRYLLGMPVLWLAMLLVKRPEGEPKPLRLGQLLQLGAAM